MIEDYQENYFHTVNGYNHPAGWSDYTRRPMMFAGDVDDQGEAFKTQHFKFYNEYKPQLAGKSVLELGCALGFFTDDMRQLEVKCDGIDRCAWAAAHSEYCATKDARTYIPTLVNNTYDTIVGLRFLPCLTDEEVAALAPHILRVAANAIFVVDDTASYGNNLAEAQKYYNVKTIEEWRALFPGCAIESINDPKWVAR